MRTSITGVPGHDHQVTMRSREPNCCDNIVAGLYWRALMNRSGMRFDGGSAEGVDVIFCRPGQS